MKTFFILLSCLSSLFCSAGKSDEKLLKQANEQINKHNFQNAAVHLEQVSEQGKTTTEYLEVASLVYDSLKDYKKAVNLYELLLNEKGDTGIVARINSLRTQLAATDETERILLEKRKNCPKCHGTGYYSVTITCPICSGTGRIIKDCPRCHGTGKMMCPNCHGTGKIENTDATRGEKTVSPCTRCMGTGVIDCDNMCDHGKITVICTRCSGTGTITKQVKCDLHP